MLYISTGDGSNPNPPDDHKTGQDITDLLSSILRIDADREEAGKHYAVPKDNPFTDETSRKKNYRPEVWAYGFRNPWRMSFDRKTGELWTGDVGWEAREMVYKVEKGGNYGWSIMEGSQRVNTTLEQGPTPIRPPMVELSHADAASVTGGYVYRGKKFPELTGQYIFGDWETRRIWAAKFENGELKSLTDLVRPSVRLSAFGEDADGEIYYLDYDAGTVHRLARDAKADYDPAKFPRKLSQTGVFASTLTLAPAAGVVPYAITAHQWQDGATSEYLLAVPGGKPIVEYADKRPLPGSVEWHNYRLHFPAGSVLAKTLSLPGAAGPVRVETQLLHFDGENWNPYTYGWDASQSDAQLVAADGSERIFETATGPRLWSYAGRSQCTQCHNSWAEATLGFRPEQLNLPIIVGGESVNQLVHFENLGLWQRRGKDNKPMLPRAWVGVGRTPKTADPADVGESLDRRARSYLNINCGHCHRFGGGGAVEFELHDTADLKPDRLRKLLPVRGDFGLPEPRVIAPGHPERSTLLYRVAKVGSGRMPHLGSESPDPAGAKLLGDWIRSLDAAAPAKVAVSGEALEKPADALLLACGFDGLPPAEREKLLALAAKLPAGPVRDLFEARLPQPPLSERKLGTNPRPKAILALAGDAGRGRAVFRSTQAQCSACHRLENEGKLVGPDLAKLLRGKTKDYVLEHILEPSKKIDAEWQTFAFELADGKVFSGLVARRDDKIVRVRDAQAVETDYPLDAIESMKPSRVSLMPDGLLRDLTPQQAADLLEYLRARAEVN